MKRNYLKKIILLALSTMMVTSVLAGCGSSTSPTQAPAAVTNKAPAEYKGTIKIWSWNTELKDLGIIDILTKFTRILKLNLCQYQMTIVHIQLKFQLQ